MVKKPKSDDVSKEAKKVAKNLGVNLEESDDGKGEKESDSPKKTDTEVVEGAGRDDEAGKSSKEEKKSETDYETLYKASSKEVSEKFLPMAKQVEELQKTTGKDIKTLLEEATGTPKEEPKKTEEKKDASKDESEVVAKVSSIEEDLNKLKEKVSEHDREVAEAAKAKVKAFKDKYGISDSDYEGSIQPLLGGISKMSDKDGNPYTLEAGLELAYLIAHKDDIENIVDKKVEILEKQKKLGTFSPTGAKESSSIEKPEFTEAQKEFAERMRVNLDSKEEDQK
jgi:hypothetical protein